MNRLVSSMVLLALLAGASTAAQQQTGQASLATTLNVYVFPKAGQAGDRQSRDEAECYEWAVSRSGADPFEASRQSVAAQQQASEAQQQTARATQGAGVRGAVGGATVGALIGEIASDDAGEGAAYGAAAGAIMARRRAANAQQQTTQQGQQQIAQANAQAAGQIENFKKAFSVCLEAKEYLVKY